MNKIYHLKNAMTLNSTGEKYDAVSMPTNVAEIKEHRHQFREFDFPPLKKTKFTT